jgi:eukaryotic-like serine/threonine-protein kinase
MTPWSPGTKIGSYEIVDLLGRGGMGAVYRVRHLITNRIEAMKIVASSNSDASAEMAERFNREIRVLASLNHPNIASLHNAFQDGDQLVMVMEYVEGTDLTRRLSSGISIEQALDFTRQILRALEYAHSENIIHRDIKSSNIMVTPSCCIKLLDFGLALSGPDTRLTTSGGLVGSMHYISPEQLSGESPDARSDLYAVGVTLYELITKRMPIDGGSHAQIIANHLQHHPTPPARINPDIPETLSAVVMKALAKDKKLRWQSASEFLWALEDAQLSAAPGALLRSTATATDVRPPAGPSEPGHGTASIHQPAVLAEIAQRLANHVGPIANILVKRASSHTHNLRELCEAVAKEIESADARQKFLSSVQGHIRASGHL